MQSKLIKAAYAFYRSLFESECQHKHAQVSQRLSEKGVCICPDCGYHIKISWHMLKCRTCGAKRHPRLTPDQQVKPLYRYCQHCGGSDSQLSKRAKINAFEIPYAVCLKEIDYIEPLKNGVAYRYEAYARKNPFEEAKQSFCEVNRSTYKSSASAVVVEGTVLRKVESIQPGRTSSLKR